MSVLLETSKGDVVVDLFVEDCPLTAKNFLKLCKYAIGRYCCMMYACNERNKRLTSKCILLG